MGRRKKVTSNGMPVKGQIITMNLGSTAAAGTNNKYRVLKIDGNQAEVVAMYEYSTDTVFNSVSVKDVFSYIDTKSGYKKVKVSQKYENSNLDKVLNETFYNSLNDTAKAAIVDKTIIQEARSLSSSTYEPYYHRYFTDTMASSSIAGPICHISNSIIRKVYALDIQDIIDYLELNSGDTIYDTQLWEMFWDTTTTPETLTYPWLRSTNADDQYYIYCIFSQYGYITHDSYGIHNAARPAFTIDLSKVEWN